MQNGFAGSDSFISTNRPSAATQETSDAALVERIKDGNRLAMQLLFTRHHVRVYRFILRMVGEAAIAEDLTSEVFLAVWHQAERFKASSTVSTWLLAIARYQALSELRRRRREAVGEDNMALIEDTADAPDLALGMEDRRQTVRSCITRLSPEHQLIIDLAYYHEKSVQEVAEIVGIPCNTVKNRMFYARRKLSELLEAAGVA